MSKKARIIKSTISLLLGIAMIAAFIVLGNSKYVKDDKSSVNLADTYSGLNKNNTFKIVTADQVIDLLKKGTGVVFLGFSSCPWCQAYLPMLDEIAKLNNISNIYYCDIKEDRAQNTKDYQEIVKIIKPYLSNDDEGNSRIYVPNVTFVKDGQVVANDNETSMLSGANTIEYWNEGNVANFKSKMQNYFNLISTTCTNCN